MQLLQANQRMLIWACFALLTYSCSNEKEVFIPIEVASGNVKLQVPKTWSRHKILKVFSPDCATCSGGEYGEMFTDSNTNGVAVTVEIRLQNVKSLFQSKNELAALREKNPGGVILDTLFELRNGCQYSRIAYKGSNDKFLHRYRMMSRWAGRYRTVILNFQSEDSDKFRETIRFIEHSTYISPDFLKGVKL